MKKLIVYLSAIVAVFVLLFVVKSMTTAGSNEDAQRLYNVKASKLSPQTVEKLKDPNYQNIILPAAFDKSLENKEPMFVYYFQPDCSHCAVVTPMLSPLAKDLGVDMKQFNLTEFTNYWQKSKIEGTPTLVYYKDGKEVDRIVGENSKEKYTEFLNKYKG